MTLEADERLRIAELYSTMNDDELASVAEDFSGLSDIAQLAMRSEYSRRELMVPDSPAPELHHDLDSDELQTVANCRDAGAVAMVRVVLEGSGIEVFLRDENIIRMNWLYANAIGGIKVEVRKQDAARATELLEQSTFPESFHVDGIGEFVQPRCPSCGAINTSLIAVALPGTTNWEEAWIDAGILINGSA